MGPIESEIHALLRDALGTLDSLIADPSEEGGPAILIRPDLTAEQQVQLALALANGTLHALLRLAREFDARS